MFLYLCKAPCDHFIANAYYYYYYYYRLMSVVHNCTIRDGSIKSALAEFNLIVKFCIYYYPTSSGCRAGEEAEECRPGATVSASQRRSRPASPGAEIQGEGERVQPGGVSADAELQDDGETVAGDQGQAGAGD